MRIGDLVICGDYYGIIRALSESHTATVFLGNGLTVDVPASDLVTVKGATTVTMNFAELLK